MEIVEEEARTEERPASISKIWNRIKQAEKDISEANEEYKKFKAEYDIISLYHIEPYIEEARKALIRLAIDETFKKNGIKNISVDQTEINDKFKEKEFKEQEIEEYITKRYMADADKTAYTQILNNVKRLIPTILNENRTPRKATIDDVLKGRRLILNIYWRYGSVDYDTMEKIDALEKLINITILNDKPSNAEGRFISEEIRIFRTSADYGQARTYVFDTDIIKCFKLYKNGKFEIQFKKAADARKVAEAIFEEAV